MAVLSKLYTFLAGAVAQPNEVNVNFDDIIDFVNDEVVHKDGTVAMTAHLSGPATDPTAANQYTRKAYVDASDLLRPRMRGLLNGVVDTNTVQCYVTGGSFVVTLDGSGNAAVPFQTAFPNGIIAVTASNGDLNATPAYPNVGGKTAAGFSMNWQHPSGTSMAGATVRVDFIALGY